LVNHCVNDILVQGARPLFFLDYLATGELDESTTASVVEGIARGCLNNRCALLGGETAEMPGFYAAGEYDLAGFIVGIVAGDGVIDGSSVEAGDVLVGMASSGLHTNGYSLARKIVFDRMGLDVGDVFPDSERTVGEVLLDVHLSYQNTLLPEVSAGRVRALAHITGSGIPGNLPRSLPEGCGAVVDSATWQIPPLFQVLQQGGGVETDEMFRVFNMGVGMIAVVQPDEAAGLVERLNAAGESAWVCGEVVEGDGVRIV
jgi:phosphoribosylformylglycinamidine cyclo-ligase